MCTAAGLTTRLEDMDTLKQNNIDSKSRVDLICDNFLPGLPMAFDHSIADPRQSGLSVQPKPGKAANKRELSKKVKYQNELAKQGTKFSPFVLESYGRWGYRTRHIFKQIVLKVKENSSQHVCSLDHSVLTHYWRCKITLAMHRQACLGMHCRIHALQCHHKLRENLLAESNVKDRVIQKLPFQSNLAILDDTLKFDSYGVLSPNGTMGSSLLPSYSDSVFSQSYLYADEDVLLPSKAHQVDTSHIRPAPNHYLPSDLFHYKTPAELNTHRYNSIKGAYSYLHLYTDGSCNMKARRLYRSAGWGLAVFSLSPSSKALLLAELFGPVVTNSKSGYFLGANAQTNNTAELSAIGEAILWLILNWKYLSMSTDPPLRDIIIFSDSQYAINAVDGTESGLSNTQLYTKIRQLLNDFENILKCCNTNVIGPHDTPFIVPTFSIQKVKGHSGIKGNVKADMLAERGRFEICKAGRYLVSTNNSSPVNVLLKDSSKNLNCGSGFILNNIQNNLGDNDFNNDETSFVGQFPEIHCNSPSEQQYLFSDKSLSPVPSAHSSPAIHPFGLEDY